jgi:hypothetical protein
MLESVSKIFEAKIDSKLKLYREIQLPDVQLYTLQTRSDLSISRNETARPCLQIPHSCICVSDLYIPTIGPIVGTYKSLTDTWM